MPTMNLLQAINDAIKVAMREDEKVCIFGEDVGKAGGVFRTTEGIQDEFGEKRCFDTPLNESGIIGIAVGMAVYGMRPIAEIQFLDFLYPGFDQLVSEAAKMRYRSGGEFTCPMVLRTPYGGGIRGGHYHSQSTEVFFTHTAGLKVVIPSTPHDAKGLLLAAIEDPDPVVFMEPKRIYRASRGEVPEGHYTVPLGKAAVVREGTDCTIVAYGSMMEMALKGAERAAEESGANPEVIDLRTLVPLDIDTIIASVEKTGRLVVVHEAQKTCGFGAEISALVAERAVLSLEAPIVRVAGLDTPFPYTLEYNYLPNPARVAWAVDKVMTY